MKEFAVLGVQQYMFRDHFQSEAQAARTLETIRGLGFDSVEMCGFLLNGSKHPWPELLKAAGLKACALQESLEDLKKDPEGAMARARWLGTDTVAVGASVATDFSDGGQVTGMIADVNALGRLFWEKGFRVMYHNHNQELERPRQGGKCALERMIRELDRRYAGLEIDAYWLQAGGADPAAWCRRARGMVRFLHMNDCRVAPGKPGELIRGVQGTELGEGTMEWPSILEAAAAGGCRGLVLETHRDWRDGDPFLSAQISLAYIKNTLLS